MDEAKKHLQRVHLSLLGGTSPADLTRTEKTQKISFIYGLGAAGLTPFEVALDDVAMGERKKLELAGNEFERFFGPLANEIREKLALWLTPEMLYLQVELLSMETPSPTEIVTSMARAMKQGGCGCGDGCSC